MKTQDQNPDDKQRRFLLLLPILVLPFLLLLVWTLGPDQGKENEAQKTAESKVNISLPDASFQTDRPQDKMSYYAQAALDSTKKIEQTRQDPYFQNSPQHLLPEPDFNPFGPQALRSSVYAGAVHGDPTEEKIYRKLYDLNAVLNQPPAETPSESGAGTAAGTPALPGAELDRLEQMMSRMQQGSATADPEMLQVNSMLEKIMAIQHPELAAEQAHSTNDQRHGEIYAVTAGVADNPITIVSNADQPTQTSNGFYGLNEIAEQESANTIAAVVHDNQIVTSGSIVKMRLVNAVMIRGELVPKDTYIFGQAQISGERLTIDISSIRYHNSIFPVKLSVYDLDGMDGIHIPGAISRDVTKESGTDAIQGIGINSFDPNLATQAASAGIELSKNLIRKKVKLIRVTLKAGYRLLLKDQQQQSSN